MITERNADAADKAERLDQPRARRARDQHDSYAFDRRSPASKLRPSRNADGAGAAGLRDLERGHALRPAGPDLAKSRSLHPVKRPRLYAAVVCIVSDGNARRERTIRESWRAGGDARRHSPFPPARQQSTGASGISLDVGGGGDDGPARSRHRQQRRHGYRTEMA